MLSIAICDDNLKDIEMLYDLLKEYTINNNINATIQKFVHPDTLLLACNKEQFHLYILDIVMPMVSGIELGKEIRHIDREAQIIYTTTEASFALQAYVANPINYLLKPIEKVAFFETLDLALSKVDIEDNTIIVKTKLDLRTISLNQIICCEYLNRGIAYTLANGEVVHSLTITSGFSQHIAPMLAHDGFIQPHISFAVNFRFVERLNKDEFILRGGKSIPISKKQYTTVRNAYLDYRLAREVR